MVHFKNMTHYPMLLGHEAVGQVVEKGSMLQALKLEILCCSIFYMVM